MKPSAFPKIPASLPAGATPVNRVAALAALERAWLRLFRLAGGSAAERAALAKDLAARHGAVRGARILALAGDLAGLLGDHARRPLARHDIGCDCVGADEAVVLLLLATATFGEREDAMMLACLLVRPDVAPIAVSVAQRLGLETARDCRTGPLH